MRKEEKAREFINSDEIKEELGPIERMWLEQHIINLLKEYSASQYKADLTDEEIKQKAYQYGEETTAGDKYFADRDFNEGAKWVRDNYLTNTLEVERLKESNKEMLSELEEFKSKVKGLSDLNNECIMKLRNNESYIHELESTVFNSEANLRSVQSQLQESQQMNERLVEALNTAKNDLIHLNCKYDYRSVYMTIQEIHTLLQSTNQSQEKGEINFHCGCQPLETCKGLSNCRRCTHPFK